MVMFQFSERRKTHVGHFQEGSEEAKVLDYLQGLEMKLVTRLVIDLVTPRLV